MAIEILLRPPAEGTSSTDRPDSTERTDVTLPADPELSVVAVTWSGDPAPSLADLLEACGHPVGPDDRITIDDRSFAVHTPLSETHLRRGARVGLGPWPGALAAPSGGGAGSTPAVLVTSGGLGSAHAQPIGAGTSSIGRGRAAAIRLPGPTVPRQLGTIDLDTTTEGAVVATLVAAPAATNPPRSALTPGAHPVAAIDACGPVACGAHRFTVIARPTAGALPPTGDATDRSCTSAEGTVPWHRPPRRRHPSSPFTVPWPRAVAETPKPPFPWAATLTPLVVGLVLAIVVSPTMALFAAMGPVYAIGSSIEQSRRRRRTRRRAATDLAAATATAVAAATSFHATEPDSRRVSVPGPADLWTWGQGAPPRLWERRAHHPDAFVVRIGIADETVVLPTPPDDADPSAVAAIEQALHALGPLLDVPVTVTLGPHTVLGVCGERDDALEVTRSVILQMATLHGPADLRIDLPRAHVSGAAGPAGAAEPTAAWRWARWLPHRDGASDPPLTLRVVDSGPGPSELHDEPSRAADVAPTAVLAIAAHPDLLPGCCTTVIEVGPHGVSVVATVDGTAADRTFLADGIDEPSALDLAVTMAAHHDPLVVVDAADRLTDPRSPAGPPDLGACTGSPSSPAALADHVTDTWSAGPTGRRSDLAAVVGITGGGGLTLDLVAHGPHALVAGTTGAGKSELLRAWITAMALRRSPEEVAFVLVDFKGGATFDACAHLPHTVGVITDLDGDLVARALAGLDAEVDRREHLLRAAGVDDLDAYRAHADRAHATGPTAGPTSRPTGVAPLPRLVVVVDEFATLARRAPDLLTTLVSIAQRGRSLGVHLVLATQRPGGVLNDQIRANTNLRIALRLVDPTDAVDVVGDRRPAAFPVDRPGLVLLRVGPDDPILGRVAPANVPADPHDGRPSLVVVPIAATIGPTSTPPATGMDDSDLDRGPGVHPAARPVEQATWIDRTVAAVTTATERLGFTRPPPMWAPPLPASLSLASLLDETTQIGAADAPDELAENDGAAATAPIPAPTTWRGGVPLARLDRWPSTSTTRWAWRPASGPLLVVGPAGSGTTDALTNAMVATDLMASDPHEVRPHLYAVGPADPWAGLRDHPRCGATIAPHEGARVRRLVRWLAEERARRRAGAAGAPILVAIDGLADLTTSANGLDGMRLLDDLVAVWSDGHTVGIHLAATADRLGSVPPALLAAAGPRILLGTPTATDLLSIGLRARPRGAAAAPSHPVRGRGILADAPVGSDGYPGPPLAGDIADGVSIQLAGPTPWPARAPASNPTDERPHRIGSLPTVVVRADLRTSASVVVGSPWTIPIGRPDDGDDDAEASLVLHVGDHALVTGPARSGVSTALTTIALGLRDAGVDVAVVTPRPSPLERCGLARLDPDDVGPWVRACVGVPQPIALVIDDADRIDDGTAITELLAGWGRGEQHVVAGARIDRLRVRFGHWTTGLRTSRTGLVLRPDDGDGDLWSTRLPRLEAPVPPGRGVLVQDGQPTVIQIAIDPTAIDPTAGLAVGPAVGPADGPETETETGTRRPSDAR